ncbi:hypothetical protein EYZ11_003414 [Aspergillus tanneri]|uniref:Rad21/Rec8-like protein C-terminal eukaryotic domain-containing protein n=1 Tax=Aspergillus tanneri TaxID=1220188 RepID=A0A4S3JN84_9EURO|nr:hypothetical protein EYZ11_003414 [Aspergillus tanneri]
MALVWAQKLQNKIPTQAKKNAALWVFGKGIGSVGVGLGMSRFAHPLHLFSGQELYESLNPTATQNPRKRNRPSGEESDTESEVRRVRAREEYEDQVGRGDLEGSHWQVDIEIGRHASVVHDDNSSQMPWNITASIKSSRQGSVTANIFRGIGSVSDLSSRGFPESAALGGIRSRLTSASPLAGRSFPLDMEGMAGIIDEDLEGFDLSHYLQNEHDANNIAGAGRNGDTEEAATNNRLALRDRVLKSSLDQDSMNFLEFLMKKTENRMVSNGTADTDAEAHQASDSKLVSFSTLLPREKTSRAVATHGLMHILALVTKGLLSVHQEPYEDHSTEEYGARYEYGEIFLRLADI